MLGAYAKEHVRVCVGAEPLALTNPVPNRINPSIVMFRKRRTLTHFPNASLATARP